jgi:hypothetical protein
MHSTPSGIGHRSAASQLKRGACGGAPPPVRNLRELGGRDACRLQDTNKVTQRYVWWIGIGMTLLDEVGGCPRTARGDALRPLPEAVRRV